MKNLCAFFSVLVALALASVSCSKDNDDNGGEDDPWSNITLVKTVGVNNVGDKSAVLRGELNIEKLMGQNFAAGFVYSDSKSSKDDLKYGVATVLDIVSSDIDGNEFSSSVSDLRPSTSYYFRAYVKIGAQYYYGAVSNFATEKEAVANPNAGKPVDMGLPSGTKWADRNLRVDGATTDGYFQWGGLTDYDWRYKPNNLYAGYTYQALKYQGIIDNNGNLTPEHDAAHVLWGGNWRMPTKEEFEELLDPKNCNWVKEYTGWNNNWANYRVVSRINGNSIYLEASGFYNLDEWRSEYNAAVYWSSTADPTSDVNSFALVWANEYFLNWYMWDPLVTSEIGTNANALCIRSNSCLIRPVCK